MASSKLINLSEERLTRFEEAQSKQGERFAAHEASDTASFIGIRSDLKNIEEKVDKVADAVMAQHDLWTAAKTKEGVSRRNWSILSAILGIFACSGIIETAIHHFWP